MDAARLERLAPDLVVIGSGIAGLVCALRCARVADVVLLTKDRLPESSSQYAQGGIASVWTNLMREPSRSRYMPAPACGSSSRVHAPIT